jgi:hypothetical protein
MALQNIDLCSWEVMRGRNSAQLLAILRARHEYVPGAVEAALAELRRREVSGFDVSAALDEGSDIAAAATQLARQPLPNRWKLFWVLLPFLAITPLGTKHFHRWADLGYHRCSVQFLEFATIGFMVYLILIVMILDVF